MDRQRDEMHSESVGSTDEEPLSVIPLHSTNLLTLLDENGIIQYESPSIERIYGFSQDELVGEQVAEYFHPADRETVVDAFQTVVSSESYTTEAVEYRHLQADGSYRWVESVAGADPTPGELYVVNTRDIAARREREKQLQETNERLEEFAKIIGHDLRSPLTVAQSRVELAESECDSEHLSHALAAHERMKTMIADLLSFARAGKQLDGREPVDLSTLSDLCWQTVATDGADLIVDSNRTLQADRPRLRQLLENLFRNAVTHGGEDITVAVGSLERGFYIEDDGVGISPEKRDEVFSSGFSTSADGTGLGLGIVREIVEAHGWQIGVTASTDGGARFEITGLEAASVR